MPLPHPTDRSLAALVDGRLDASEHLLISRHVDQCPRCQLRVGASTHAVAPAQYAQLEGHAFEPLHENRFSPPTRGDVWRLSWEALSLLAVLWNIGDDTVTALPLVDNANADSWCALLPANVTGGLGDIAVSVAMETAVPWVALDAKVATMTDSDDLALLRSAYRTGRDDGKIRRGEVVISALDDRITALDQLAQDFVTLSNAGWAPVTATAEPAAELTFGELEQAALNPERILALRRGASPTGEEADAIEAVTGRRPSGDPIDRDLQRLIDQPARKAKIRARAQQSDRTEAAERLKIAHELSPALQAARGTGGTPVSYEELLDGLLGA